MKQQHRINKIILPFSTHFLASGLILKLLLFRPPVNFFPRQKHSLVFLSLPDSKSKLLCWQAATTEIFNLLPGL